MYAWFAGILLSGLFWFRTFVFFAATWAVIFATSTVLGASAAFEYEDGYAWTTPVFAKADARGLPGDSPDYWNLVNRSSDRERTKPAPWLLSWALRLAGFRVELIAERGREGSEALLARRMPPAAEFHLIKAEERAELLKKKDYTLYFAVSDGQVALARELDITPVRVLRNPRSRFKAPQTPGKYGEKTLPLSRL
ncbi:MAG TPA: hypothetical protein PK523_06460 [Elusimicrobiales bacterium]|nr:hypothetical protein [Elusimicrobiales bacterium]